MSYKKITKAALAVLFAAVVLTSAEREYLTSVVCVTCAGKPLCERVALAAEITDRAVHADITEAVLSVLGGDTATDKTAGVFRGSDEYRLSSDAVDAACAGARGKQKQ